MIEPGDTAPDPAPPRATFVIDADDEGLKVLASM